jgi:hypothetical protein
MTSRRSAQILLTLFLLCGAALAAAGGPALERSYDSADLAIEVDGVYSRIAVAGAERAVKTPGAPALPVEYLSFVIPADRRVADVLASWAEEEIPGTHRIAPAQPEAPIGQIAERVEPDPSIYESNDAYPSSRVVYLGDGYLGGYRIATVAVYPITYAPATGRLALARDISVELELAPAADRSQPRRRMTARSDDLYRRLVESMVENPEDVAGKLHAVEVVGDVGSQGFLPRYSPSLDGSPVEYVIVTTDEFASRFQELADWKTQKGITAVVRTVSWIDANYPGGCDTAERIRLFLADAFSSWGTTYVLIGGDTGAVPVRFAWTWYYGGEFIPTDLYYSDLDGNWNDDGDDRFGEAFNGSASPGDSLDLYPDVFVGRAPVISTYEVETFIDKVLTYEKSPNVAFAGRELLLGEVVFPYDWQPGDAIQTDGAGDIIEPTVSLISSDVHYARVYQNHTAFPGSFPLNRESALDSLGAGYNITAHVGHGNKDIIRTSRNNYITIQDVDALSNGVARSGFAWMLNCSTAAVEFDSIAEHLLSNPNGGMSGVFGPTRYCFPVTTSSYYYAWFESLYQLNTTRAGVVSALCKAPFVGTSGHDGTDRWTQLSYLLLGDPESRLWTGRPNTMIADHPPSVPLGPTDLTVTVTDPAVVDSALVCVVKGGEVYACGVTDASGSVTLSFVPRTTGPMTITVTAQDHLPYEATIGVVPSLEPHLTLRATLVNDDQIGASDGNANGMAEAGETVQLDVTIGNGGQNEASGVTATLHNGDTYITLVDDTHALGSVPGLSEVAYEEAFTLAIADDCPNEYEAPLTIELTDGTRAIWTSEFVLKIYRPSLVQARNHVDDGPGGNGVPNVGETIVLSVDLLNEGNGVADAITGVLRHPGTEVTITDSTESWGDIEPGDTVSGEAGFAFDVNSVIADPFHLVLTDADGKEWSHLFDLSPPGPLAGLAGEVKATTISLRWGPAEEPDLWGYNVYRSNQPWTNYVTANEGVVERTSYFQDKGLAEKTKYFYRVAAIDSSGNEGPLTSPFEISTNPPAQAGWPLIGQEANYGTPVIADVDLDGDLEVLVGSGEVLCWHHNGVEYMDGDGDPRTNGIFATEGLGGYRSSLAVGELDGDPYPEVVGASWGNFGTPEDPDYRIFAWNADDGTLLDGWPVSTGGFCWATPALGDLTGDGLDDVVLSSADGFFYGWSATGDELVDGDNDPSTVGVFAYLMWPYGYQYGSAALADIDDDTELEIIVPSRAESLYVFEADGTRVPGWPVWCGNRIIGSPCVGELDGEPGPEIVVVANDSDMYVFSAGGDTLAGWPFPIDVGGDFPPSPSLADLNGDGVLEIVVPDEYGTIHVLDGHAEYLDGWPRSIGENTGSSASIGDIDGDSSPDIVVSSFAGQVFALSAGGDVLDGWPIRTDAEIFCTPTLADLDVDGDVEVIVAGMDVNIYVWDCEGDYAYGQGVEWASFRHDARRTGDYSYSVMVGVPDDGELPVRAFALEQNHPNPFNPVTSIAYAVPSDGGPIELAVYNVAGRRVRTLASPEATPGRHVVVWDGRDERGEAVASGVYFVRLSAAAVSRTRKMVLLK